MRIIGALVAAGALCWTPLAAAQEGEPAALTKEEAEIAARVAVVQGHIDAYRTGNLDRFMATFTPDAEVYADGYVARGQREIRAAYRMNFAPGAPKMRIENSGLAGQFVFITHALELSDGREVCCTYSEYEVRDGKISYVATSIVVYPGP